MLQPASLFFLFFELKLSLDIGRGSQIKLRDGVIISIFFGTLSKHFYWANFYVIARCFYVFLVIISD